MFYKMPQHNFDYVYYCLYTTFKMEITRNLANTIQSKYELQERMLHQMKILVMTHKFFSLIKGFRSGFTRE